VALLEMPELRDGKLSCVVLRGRKLPDIKKTRNMRIILTISLIFLLISCGNRDVNTGISDKTINDSIMNRLDRWLNYYDLKLESFNDSLPMIERKIYSSDYDYLSDTGNLFNDLFVFSPDSLNFIDLDSYSIMLEKDSAGQLMSNGSEVDTETALIDIKGKIRIRVLFCGTDCRPEEAYWIKNDLVYILGFTKSNKMDYPTIWTFEINNNFFQEIKTKNSIDLTGKDYIANVRLKMIKFNK
jgi:hypothetical protein